MSWPKRGVSITGRYATGLACAAAALLLRFAMGPNLAARFPYGSSFVACLVAARFLGLGPALVVIGAALAGTYLIGPQPDASREILFVVTAGVAVWMLEILRRAKSRAEE